MRVFAEFEPPGLNRVYRGGLPCASKVRLAASGRFYWFMTDSGNLKNPQRQATHIVWRWRLDGRRRQGYPELGEGF
jgi:hypothetical protein